MCGLEVEVRCAGGVLGPRPHTLGDPRGGEGGPLPLVGLFPLIKHFTLTPFLFTNSIDQFYLSNQVEDFEEEIEDHLEV